MKKRLFALMLFACLLSSDSGYADFPADSGSTNPQLFAPGVVSTGREFGLSFMPDGKEAYFTRFDAEKKNNHIYRTLLVNGTWKEPTPVEFSRDEWRDLDAAVSPDGKKLFFISTRPKPGSPPGSPNKDMDIWVAERNGREWKNLRWIENVNSDAKEGSPSVDRNGTLYFFSDRGNAPNNNSLYLARLVNGKYSLPERLFPDDTAFSDTSPFIAPNGKTLLFYSNRPGGYGKGDLYAAFKMHGNWSTPINLGQIVNTPESEYNPTVSPDGNYLYFGRDRNIYTIDLRDVGVKSLAPKLFR